jgi:hypothetical protein
LFLLILFVQKLILAATAIGFENLPPGAILTNQYPCTTFSNAIVLTTGFTLDEFECPPHSGANVASDNGGPMTIVFTSPLRSISGYSTYNVPLTIQTLDAANRPIVITGGAQGSSFTVDDLTPVGKCDVNQDGPNNVSDAQAIVNEALGATPSQASDDRNADGAVNIVDVRISIDSALGLIAISSGDPALITGGGNLLRVDGNGDAVAGDGIYTLVFTASAASVVNRGDHSVHWTGNHRTVPPLATAQPRLVG